MSDQADADPLGCVSAEAAGPSRSDRLRLTFGRHQDPTCEIQRDTESAEEGEKDEGCSNPADADAERIGGTLCDAGEDPAVSRPDPWPFLRGTRSARLGRVWGRAGIGHGSIILRSRSHAHRVRPAGHPEGP